MDNQYNPDILYNEQFPLSNKYDPMWIFDNEMGPNALWLTEMLTPHFDLKPGMRVLDLGCGKGMTSVFLAREFGVQVFAVDLWENADSKWELAKQQDVEHLIVPLQADAANLPFAIGFFDAIIAIDSFMYFGQDEACLQKLLHFLRPGGKIGFITPGCMCEADNGVPEYLAKFLSDELWTWKSLPWWRYHWEKTDLVSIDIADKPENGFALWLRWEEVKVSLGKGRWGDETDIYRQDGGEYMGIIRMVATKK